MAIEPYYFFKRPLRGGDRVLQEGVGRRSVEAHTLQKSPEPPQLGMIPPGSENKIMYVSLRIGGAQ
jgi:PhnB protein